MPNTKVTDEELRAIDRPNQNFLEWKTFLEFVKCYFENRGNTHPTVVEIGTHTGAQKGHYERFLGAFHIGIDICDKYSKPDILSDSHSPETMVKLRALLKERPINLLFIDAEHTYADALAEYETYGPLVTDIIAFHDIKCIAEVGRLFSDLQLREIDNPHVVFLTIGAWQSGKYQVGIGMVIKQRNNG
jgi:hypothetical protein